MPRMTSAETQPPTDVVVEKMSMISMAGKRTIAMHLRTERDISVSQK